MRSGDPLPTRSLFCLVGVLLACACASCDAFDPEFGYLRSAAEAPDAGHEGDAEVSFARDIRPLMNRAPGDPVMMGGDPPAQPAGNGCKACHYSTEPKHVGYDLGGLDLATLGALRKGGATSGAAIVVPGKPEESVLMQKLRGTYPFGARMPRSGPPYWSDDEIELVEYWIADGAEGADDE